MFKELMDDSVVLHQVQRVFFSSRPPTMPLILVWSVLIKNYISALSIQLIKSFNVETKSWMIHMSSYLAVTGSMTESSAVIDI